MPQNEKRAVDHESPIRHAQALMMEALQLLDSTGARQSASLLDHAICVLPHEEEISSPIFRQSNEAH